MEGKPKDVRSGLRREPDTHWNLILPQLNLIYSSVVSVKTEEWALFAGYIIFYKHILVFKKLAQLKSTSNETRDSHETYAPREQEDIHVLVSCYRSNLQLIIPY